MSSLSKREVGQLGEDLAARYLEKRGFRIIDRNYRKKWGEIDLVALKDGITRFVEVKARLITIPFVPRETYRLEDKLHPQKLKRIHRALESYLLEKDIAGEWEIDLITVSLDSLKRSAHCEWIRNVL